MRRVFDIKEKAHRSKDATGCVYTVELDIRYAEVCIDLP